MPDGDLWKALNDAILAKGSKYIKFSKVKGHATDRMVESKEVEQRDKDGNDEADDVAGKGVEEEQPELAGRCGAYARRNEAYRKMMERIGKYIVKVKKRDKIKRDKKKLEMTPLADECKNKITIPIALKYDTPGENTKMLEIRGVERHDE